MTKHILSDRAIKCTIVLDASEVAKIPAVEGQVRTALQIMAGSRSVMADIATKSLRKAQARSRRAVKLGAPS